MVATVEAHESVLNIIVKLAGDVLIVDILGHGVVDIQQSHRILGNTRADVLRKGTVNIDLTGHRDTT